MDIYQLLTTTPPPSIGTLCHIKDIWISFVGCFSLSTFGLVVFHLEPSSVASTIKASSAASAFWLVSDWTWGVFTWFSHLIWECLPSEDIISIYNGIWPTTGVFSCVRLKVIPHNCSFKGKLPETRRTHHQQTSPSRIWNHSDWNGKDQWRLDSNSTGGVP